MSTTNTLTPRDAAVAHAAACREAIAAGNRRPNYIGPDLSRADLHEADLTGANLTGADLSRADLTGANLSRADLSRADLPAPTVTLLASWGPLSDDLTRDLMRYDAACHPDPSAFDRWAAGGECPYAGVKVSRAANFTERRDLWSPSPSERPYDLMARVLAEKCPPWTDEQRATFVSGFSIRPQE